MASFNEQDARLRRLNYLHKYETEEIAGTSQVILKLETHHLSDGPQQDIECLLTADFAIELGLQLQLSGQRIKSPWEHQNRQT